MAQVPVRKLSIEVDESARVHFLSIVEEIARSRQFQFRTARVSPVNEYFIVEMVKPQFRVIVANDLEIGTFDVRIFENTVRPFPGDEADLFLLTLVKAVERTAGVHVLPTGPGKK